MEQAQKLGNVECVYTGTQLPDIEGQAALIRNLTDSAIDGIALAVIDDTSDSTLDSIAQDAVSHGVHVYQLSHSTQTQRAVNA